MRHERVDGGDDALDVGQRSVLQAARVGERVLETNASEARAKTGLEDDRRELARDCPPLPPGLC